MKDIIVEQFKATIAYIVINAALIAIVVAQIFLEAH
jgi:hypothetical protein